MAENDSYTPENDLDLEQSLEQQDIYTPENDLSLTESLQSTTTFAVSTASAAGSGNTISVSGSSTFDISTASATGTGSTLNLAGGTATLDTVSASATGTGATISVLDTNLDIVEASATGAGGTGLTLDIPPRPTTTATATATGASNLGLEIDKYLIESGASATGSGETTSIDVPGTKGEITVLIEGQRINTYTNIEAKRRLNEVDTFSFEAFIEDSSDRQLIQEGNTVKIIESYNDLLFKGVLNEVEYKSNFRAKCEGNGMVQKLLDRKTDRDTYTNTAGDTIIKSEVPASIMSRGTIEAAPNISVRFDHDNLARAVAGVSNATGYDWFIDQNAADNYDTDYLNFVKDAGRGTVQETFDIGNNAQLIERNKDEGFIANDITLLGRGDGINQLEANVFAAATAYTDTSQVIDETENTSFTVDDATQLGATGDNLIVRVGTEVMDVNISDSTTLSINSRGLNDYNGDATEQIKHYENIRVWRLENVTQGIGRFSPDNPEAGSSIDQYNIKEQRETDKTIVDISTLEKTADLELKNRFEDVFRVQVEPTDPRATRDLQLGDTVVAKDLTAMDVDDQFNIVGMDVKRNSAQEGTTLHLANRPRRLTERLSEIESNTDTLNAHMQGATNFNGEHFEDNADNTHPLNNKIFVPDDVVAINKFELTFARESFRGYTESTEEESQHTHSFQVNIPDHDHDFTVPSHDHDIQNFLESDGTAIRFSTAVPGSEHLSTGSAKINIQFENDDDFIFTSDSDGGASHNHYWPDAGSGGQLTLDLGQSGLSHTTQWPASSFLDTAIGCDILTTNDGNPPATTESGGFVSDTTKDGGAEIINDTTEQGSAHSHGINYGIFEPNTEPNIDIEVRVDGNLVTTINNVSVGEEVANPIDLKPFLGDPLTGAYHDVELVPVDTGGGNNGRSRLVADVTEKVFIESTL